MDSRKFVLQQTLIIAIGQIVGVGVMLGIAFYLCAEADKKAALAVKH